MRAALRGMGVVEERRDHDEDPLKVAVVAVRYIYMARAISFYCGLLDVALGVALMLFPTRFTAAPGFRVLVATPGGSWTWGACFAAVGVGILVGHYRRDFPLLRLALLVGALAGWLLATAVAVPFVVDTSPPSGLIVYAFVGAVHLLDRWAVRGRLM